MAMGASTTRTFFLLATLSVHYSLLSIALHYSRTLETGFHPSAAIVSTELGKIIVSLSLVAHGGELRETMRERRKLRDEARFRQVEEEERRLLAEEQHRDRERARDWERDQIAGAHEHGTDDGAEAQHHGGTKLHQRKSSTSLAPPKNVGLSINVDRARSFVPQTPSLAVIPPTPAPEPSPTGVQEVSLLFPHRPTREPDERRTIGQDLRDSEWWNVVKASVFGHGSSSVAMVAGIYALQNRAQYTAAANLSVPLFQLAYQLKIPATAMCSVVLLNRALSTQQWVALFALTFGVGIVQLCSVLADATALNSTALERSTNQFVGLAAVVFACLSSGCASVAFERILKVPSSRSPVHSSGALTSSPSCSSPTLPSSTQPPLPDWTSLVPPKPSLWIRNIQLSVFGLIASLPFLVYEAAPLTHLERLNTGLYPGESISSRVVEGVGLVTGTFFQGFSSPIVWLVIFLQVSGGLLSALVILHADNLLKCFATSLSILLSLFAAILFFDFHITPGITFGAAVVLLATLAYTSPATFQTLLASPFALLLRLRR